MASLSSPCKSCSTDLPAHRGAVSRHRSRAGTASARRLIVRLEHKFQHLIPILVCFARRRPAQMAIEAMRARGGIAGAAEEQPLMALRRSATMQSAPGHPPGCMVALGCMSAPTAEHAAVAEPLTQSRARTRAGFVRCVGRGVASGELSAGTDVASLAAVFDSFLSGVSILARDGVGDAVLDAAVTQILRVWDASRPVQPPAHPPCLAT